MAVRMGWHSQDIRRSVNCSIQYTISFLLPRLQLVCTLACICRTPESPCMASLRPCSSSLTCSPKL
eukprot:scaffold313793_cov21-Tisochrysis_lutea.AAC.2